MFIHLIAISLYSTVVDRLIDALRQVQGAYSLVALHNGALIGARDPLGVRPLVLGRLGGEARQPSWVLASETCALDIVGAEFVRDIDAGEIIVIDDKGVHSIKPFAKQPDRFCIFEYIYFARPELGRRGHAGLPDPQAASAPSWRARAASRPMWWCRCRTAACRRRWAIPWKAASPSSSGSSATTMSAAPSSSRPTRSATSA